MATDDIDTAMARARAAMEANRRGGSGPARPRRATSPAHASAVAASFRAPTPSPVARLELSSSAAPRGRSPSGLNATLSKVMNPSKSVQERFARHDAQAAALEAEADADARQLREAEAGSGGATGGGVDAELEALKAQLAEKEQISATHWEAPAQRAPAAAAADAGGSMPGTKRWSMSLRRKSKGAPESSPADADDGGTSRRGSAEKLVPLAGSAGNAGGRREERPAADRELQLPEGYVWHAPSEHGAACEVCNLVLAIIVGLVLLGLLLSMLGVSLVAGLLQALIGAVTSSFFVHFIVNTLYVSRAGIVKEWCTRGSRRYCRCCRDHDEHSRPLRVDVNLPPLAESVAAAAGAPPPQSSRRSCTVHTIALFYDNYAYLIVDTSQGTKPFPCALVDPAEADGVMEELRRLAVAEYGAAPGAPLARTLQVEAILTTHKHWDHAWGNAKLTDGATIIPQPVVFGGVYDKVDCCTHPLDESSTECVVGSLAFEILHTPCHTAGSIMFWLRGVDGR